MTQLERIYPGIWRLTFGEPDALTPHTLLGAAGEKQVQTLLQRPEHPLPFSAEAVTGEALPAGYRVTLPLGPEEGVYGLGLQMYSFRQNGRRKTLRTNADAPADTGDAHAPVPFFVSTRGDGVLVDTARCVTFDFGAAQPRAAFALPKIKNQVAAETAALYQEKQRGAETTVYLRGAGGVTLYLFASSSMQGAVEAYNLFCGGGVLPPIWGLGTLYRAYSPADQKAVEALIAQLRTTRMPVSMLGLEPGWQSHSYSCSFCWDSERFPQPQSFVETLRQAGMRLNLWEQAYVHPTAPFYEELFPYAGDHGVWGGLAPDFALGESADIYGRWQGRLIEEGAAAVKLDECDGSDYTGGWFYPDDTQFPCGLDGEQERNLYGALVQRVIQRKFHKRGLRTFSQVRAGWSYGAPMGFVLYSDLYDHKDFIRALVNSGFAGLLWSPEVRQCRSAEALLRRIQTVVFSPLSLINAWMIPNPPWEQFDIQKNKENELLQDTTLRDRCRELLRLRISLIPYLYEAFARYESDGTPPFRALVLEDPEDPALREVDDAYMMGRDLLVAPIPEGMQGRQVVLPRGIWYDFWTGRAFEGGRTVAVETEKIPVFVRAGTIFPFARNTSLADDTVFDLEARVYGAPARPCRLVEDDGMTLEYRHGGQVCGRLTYENGRVEMGPMQKYRLAAQKIYPTFRMSTE